MLENVGSVGDVGRVGSENSRFFKIWREKNRTKGGADVDARKTGHSTGVYECWAYIDKMENKDIIEKGKCCACGLPLNLWNNANLVLIKKIVTWSDPVWNAHESSKSKMNENNYGVALMCNLCKAINATPGYIVEFRGQEIIYHDLSEKK